MNYEKASIREFSQEHNPEARRAVATEIRALHKKFSAREERVDSAMERVSQMLEDVHVRLGDIARYMTELEAEISAEEAGTLQMLYNLIRKTFARPEQDIASLQDLKIERASHEVEEKKLSARQNDLEQRLEKLETYRRGREYVDATRRLLARFYAQQNSELALYEAEELRNRQIENVVATHNVIVMHGIRADFEPHGNSMLSKEVDWETKVRIALSFDPTLSASTTEAGDSEKSAWSWIGLIVARGTVEAAAPYDSGSIFTGIGNRHMHEPHATKDMRARDKIRFAIEQKGKVRGKGHMNEITVREPQFAAFFIHKNRHAQVKAADPNRAGITPFDRIQKLCSELGLPVVIIEDGVAYPATYANKQKTFRADRKNPYTPEQLIATTFALPKEKKELLMRSILRMRIFLDSAPNAEYL